MESAETTESANEPIAMAWLHRQDKVRYTRPDLWLIMGIRGSGKSSFAERVAEQYMLNGAAVIDLFGSADSEGLAWLRSPYKDKRFLLLKGDGVSVRCEHDVKPVQELAQRDLDDYDIIINASALYCSRDDEYIGADRISQVLYNRSRHKHSRLLCALVREGASFFYAKLKVTGSQQEAKAGMMYMLREARHNYIAMVADALYTQAVEKELRMSVDYTVIKAMGMMRLPEHISWLYNTAYSKVAYTSYQNLKPWEFFLVTKAGALAFGMFDAVPWHKNEREHLPSKLGIEIEYSKQGAPSTKQDDLHVVVVKSYAEGKSSTSLSEELHISSRTVMVHVRKHNKNIEDFGMCPTCTRLSSPYASCSVNRGCANNEKSENEG